MILDDIQKSYKNRNWRLKSKMKWLEIIELRTVDFDKEVMEVQLEKLLNEFARKMEEKGIKSYRRVTVDSDFSIHLFHETEQIEICGSELGLHLVSALREFGMINHSIWQETGDEKVHKEKE